MPTASIEGFKPQDCGVMMSPKLKQQLLFLVLCNHFTGLLRVARRSRDGIKGRDGLRVCRKSAGHAAIRKELVPPLQVDETYSR